MVGEDNERNKLVRLHACEVPVFPSLSFFLSFSLTSDISIFWFSLSLRSGSNGPKCSGLVLLVFPGFRPPNLQIHLIRLQIFLPG
ncbi:hypothetical protein VNO78_10673 [Psophocarpus tetragonolobus]|uniref:Uncharacterized protein n=1 Tax=Psophocarpus tetragonolobus TaxID=3891 RepID=A0AAN9XMY8_PSOTE